MLTYLDGLYIFIGALDGNLVVDQGNGKEGVKAYMKQKGLIQISDVSAIEALVDDVLAANPKQLQDYCAGKVKLQGFFVGYAMLSPWSLHAWKHTGLHHSFWVATYIPAV